MALKSKESEQSQGALLRWVRSNSKYLTLTSIAAAGIAVYQFLHIELDVQLYFVSGALLTLSYAIPFTSNKGLRYVPFIKTIIVAVVWGIATVAPVVEIWDVTAFVLLMVRVFFVLSLTLPFEIRDVEIDKKDELVTIVGQIGVEKTKLMAFAFLFTSAFLHLAFFPAFHKPLILSFALPTLILYDLNRFSGEYSYTFGLDGCMIFQLASLYLWHEYVV